MTMGNSPSYEPEDDPPTCKTCGTELEWVDCWHCGSDGEIDEHEDDPINFAPGEEYRPCPECGGQGGWLECPNVPHENTAAKPEEKRHEQV